MDIAEFKRSLSSGTPPAGLSAPVTALWHAGKDDWSKAHGIVQDDDSAAAAWVHAHLHRVEGDLDNARYWYRRAGKPASDMPLDDEWESIGAALLAERQSR